MDEVLISALPGDRRAAALADGRLARLLVEDDGAAARAGDVFLGRVRASSPAIDGVFVDLGRPPAGLLMTADAPRGRRPDEGDAVVVRVLRSAEDGKGPKLSARPDALPADLVVDAVARPPCRLVAAPDPIEVLLRRAETGLRRVVVDDAAVLQALRRTLPALASRIEPWRGAAPLFAAAGIDEQLEAALAPDVPLPSGGRVRIEETAALTAIDVDVGATPATSARVAALRCDIEAATEIARQLALRRLGGLVVVDFVPLRRAEERARLLEGLRAALAQTDDERPVRVAGYTRLGLVELICARSEASLMRRLTVACPACAGGGRTRAPRLVAGDALRALLAEVGRGGPARRSALACAPVVAAAFAGEMAAARAYAEGRLGSAIDIVADPALAADGVRRLCEEGSRR